MGNFNRVIFMGHLATEPTLHTFSNGDKIARFSIAYNRNWKKENGNSHTETCFVRCKAKDKKAETIANNCYKGRPLLIEGRLINETFFYKKAGVKIEEVKILVENFEFLDKKKQEIELNAEEENEESSIDEPEEIETASSLLPDMPEDFDVMDEMEK